MKIKTDKGDRIEQKFGYLIINGEPYKPKIVRGDMVFEKKSKEELELLEKRAKEVAEKLKDSLDAKKILTEALMKLEKEAFDTLHKSLFGKKKLKPKTREHACVDMKIGNFILPIMD